MQTIYGLYFKTNYRDLATGETEFSFAPNKIIDNAYEGLIKCRGKIGIYTSRTPLMLKGEFVGNIFIVDICTMPTNNPQLNVRVLKYIDDNLSDSQCEKISEICDNDLTLLASNDRFDDIYNCFSRTSKTNEEKTYISKKIIKGLIALTSRDELTKELIAFGVPADRIECLIKQQYTMSIIKHNPYIPFINNDISINIAENIAMKYLKVSPYAPIRISSFILYALKINLSNGNTCIRLDMFTKVLNRILKSSLYPEMLISESLIEYYLHFIKDDVRLDELEDGTYIYLSKVYNEELTCVEQIKRLTKHKNKLVCNLDVTEYEKLNGIKYNEEQINCMDLLKESGIKILTGPPGSGKTAIIKLLIQLYKKQFKGKKIKLAATTGRAAQVMKEACGINTQTVHKLLDLRLQGNVELCKNLNNPIDANFVIVDEVSMLDLQMFSLLLSAIRSGSLLLLVGDKDQLESVGYGNVLSDLIHTGMIPIYELNKVIRSNKSIFENAQKVNHGCSDLNENANFIIRKAKNESELKRLLLNDLKSFEENQVICPIKGSPIGVECLNIDIQTEKMKKEKPVIVYNRKLFYIHDKIIMLQNNYKKDYFNGDIGEIIKKYENEEKIAVQFADKTIDLTTEDFLYMDLAYVVTAHKSQGSGFKNVFIVLPDSVPFMLTRKMLYTAITRAKNNVYIYSINNSLDISISNKGENVRITKLKEKITQNMG